MFKAVTYISLLALSTVASAEGLFVAGSFSRDKIQSEAIDSRVHTQDADFYSVKGGVYKGQARYYVEYANSALKGKAKLEMISVNADYIHPVNDRINLLVGGQVGAASVTRKQEHVSDGWGIGARVGGQMKLGKKAKLESGIQATQLQDIKVMHNGHKDEMEIVRGAYVSFEFEL